MIYVLVAQYIFPNIFPPYFKINNQRENRQCSTRLFSRFLIIRTCKQMKIGLTLFPLLWLFALYEKSKGILKFLIFPTFVADALRKKKKLVIPPLRGLFCSCIRAWMSGLISLWYMDTGRLNGNMVWIIPIIVGNIIFCKITAGIRIRIHIL